MTVRGRRGRSVVRVFETPKLTEVSGEGRRRAESHPGTTRAPSKFSPRSELSDETSLSTGCQNGLRMPPFVGIKDLLYKYYSGL